MKLDEARRDAIAWLEWQICRYTEYESRVEHDATKATAEEYRPEIPRDVLQWLIDLVAKNDPQGYTQTTTDHLTRAEQLLLAQMQQLQATTAEILSGEGCKFELVNTADKAQQLTKGMCRLSMELRLLQHLKREPTIDGEVRGYIPTQELKKIVETQKQMLKARGVQRT